MAVGILFITQPGIGPALLAAADAMLPNLPLACAATCSCLYSGGCRTASW